MSTPQPYSFATQSSSPPHQPTNPGYGPPSRNTATSSTALAVSVFVFFAVLAVLVVLAIALLR